MAEPVCSVDVAYIIAFAALRCAHLETPSPSGIAPLRRGTCLGLTPLQDTMYMYMYMYMSCTYGVDCGLCVLASLQKPRTQSARPPPTTSRCSCGRARGGTDALVGAAWRRRACARYLFLHVCTCLHVHTPVCMYAPVSPSLSCGASASWSHVTLGHVSHSTACENGFPGSKNSIDLEHPILFSVQFRHTPTHRGSLPSISL